MLQQRKESVTGCEHEGGVRGIEVEPYEHGSGKYHVRCALRVSAGK